MSKTVKYIVPRDSSDPVYATVSVTYRDGIDIGAYDFCKLLCKAVTAWMKETKDGLDALIESCEDFNIGDLASVSDESMSWIISKIPSVEKIEIKTDSIHPSSNFWSFDDRLFDRDELDPLIEKAYEDQHE